MPSIAVPRAPSFAITTSLSREQHHQHQAEVKIPSMAELVIRSYEQQQAFRGTLSHVEDLPRTHRPSRYNPIPRTALVSLISDALDIINDNENDLDDYLDDL